MDEATRSRIAEIVSRDPVVLFMKGTPDEPQCGFSAQVVHLLRQAQCTFSAHNVLDDWDLREGIKAFSQWPTIPQLYVGGSFIGGCDIVMEMDRRGELAAALNVGS